MNLVEKDTLRVACWNVEHNGTSKDGGTKSWTLAMEILESERPHLVLRQELTHAEQNGHRRLYAEANHLGLTPLIAPATPESKNPTGVFLDPELFTVESLFIHVTAMWHPICNPVVRLKGTSKPLSLASVHLCSWDPATRATEARRLTVLGKPGMSALFGGDMNSYPHRPTDETTPLPDWEQVPDTSHFEHRTIERNGSRVSDTRPDEILAGGKRIFVELGHHAATVLQQTDALRPTASLTDPKLGPRQRIDRMYATPDLAPALTSLRVIDSAAVSAVSDHALLVADFSLSALRRALTSAASTAALA